jgi:anti-sigma factor RsiW
VNCSHVRDLLPLYADDDLDEPLAHAVSSHLGACPDCRRRLDLDRHLTEVLGTLDAWVSPDLHERAAPAAVTAGRVIAQVAAERRRRSFAGLVGIVLVGAIAVALVLLNRPIVARPEPSQAATPAASPDARPTVAISPGPGVASLLPPPPPSDPVQLHRRVNPVAAPPPTTIPVREEPIGTEHDFEVPAPPSTPRAHASLRARLVAQTPHVDWYVEDRLDFPATSLQAAIDSVEGHAYPIVQRFYGRDIPPSIDGNPRVTILIGHLPAVEQGSFDVGDLLPRWINPSSNERKLLYVSADNAQIGSAIFTARMTLHLADMAWETGHPLQDFWVHGGSKLVATQDASGSLGDTIDPNALSVFALHPAVQLNAYRPEQANSSLLSVQAVHYLFARYVADRFGISRVFPALYGVTGRGPAAYDEVFHHRTPPTSFDAVFADWVAANVLDAPSLDDGRYGYRSGIALHPAELPGPTLGQSIGGQATQFGATYYHVQPSTPATLAFTGDATVPLIAANPHSGGYEWWSNHGDMIDTRLTRPVDLRAVTTATLGFWAWYETEKDDDYAYVEVSTDGGASWQTLHATDTTRDNPNGANLGEGFTGSSGGNPLRWVPESVDLTPDAGRQILLRFEYVTDEAVQGDGFVLDDVEIPEINFRDTASSDNGWIAEGFVRTGNVVPQPWLVEIISGDRTQPVRQLVVRRDGTASLELQANEKVVVAIAGLAPDSTQQPTYQLRLTPRSS